MPACARFALFVSLLLASAVAYSQEPRFPRNPWDDKRVDLLLFRDYAERQALAERIIAAREGSETFSEAYKRHLLFELTRLSVRELLEIERTGRIKETSIGDTGKDLIYTPLVPCRVIDTRFSTTGIMTGGVTRVFYAADHGAGFFTNQGGNASGCGVPYGTATAVHVNLVAVSATGQGNMKAWAYDTSEPGAAAINYNAMTPTLNIANAIILPICNPSVSSQCSNGDLNVLPLTTTHLVADVYGYFSRFPSEAKRSFAWNAHYETGTTIASSCTHHGDGTSGARVVVTVPEVGKVYVEGTAVIQLNHTSGADDEIELHIGTSSSDCTTSALTATRYLIPGAAATASNYKVTIPVSAVFSVDPAQSTTASYFLNARNLGSTSGADTFVSSAITATFHPN